MKSTRTVRTAVATALAFGALTAAATPSGADCSAEASFDQETDTTVPVYGRAFMLWVDDEGQYVGGGRDMAGDGSDTGGYFEVYPDGPTVDNKFGPSPASPQCLTAGALPGAGTLPGPGSLPEDPGAGGPTTTSSTTSTTSTTVSSGNGSTPGTTLLSGNGDADRAVVLSAQASRSVGTGLARTGGTVTDTVALGASLLAVGAALVLLARARSTET